MKLRAQVLTGIRWTATARLFSQLISWAITLIVIRILSPSDYGLIAMAMAFVALAAVFSQLGLGGALVQARELDERLLRRGFGAILVINLSLAALLMLAAPFIAVFYDEPRVESLVRVLSLQFVLGSLAVIPDVLLQRRMEFRNRSLVDLSGTILGSLTTLGLALAGAGVWSIVAGSLVSQAWTAIGLNLLSPYLRWPEFSMQGMRSLFRFGGQQTATGVLGVLYFQADIIICAKWLGNEIVGFYSVAMHIASLPSQRISGIVTQVAFPAFSSIQHDLRDVGAKALLGVRLLSLLAFPLLWGFSSVVPEFVQVVLGPKWELSIIPLQVIALIIPFRMIGSVVGIALQGIGRTDIALHNIAWALVVGPVLFFAGAYSAGLVGLSLSWLFVTPLIFVPFMMRSAPAIGLRPAQIFAAILPAAGAGLTMYVAVAATRYIVADALGGVLRMCVLIAAGALVYCAMSFVFNRKGTHEALELIWSLARPQRA